MTSRAFAQFGILLAVFALHSTEAWGEVCDKVRPGWKPGDGAPDQWTVAGEVFTSWLGVAVLAILIAAFAARKRALYKLSAFAMLLLAVVVIWQPINDGVLAAAIEEGCEAAPDLPVAILISLGILMAALSRFSGRQR